MNRILTRIRDFCISSFPLVAFALVISNFVVSCCVARSNHPKFVYKTFVITNEVVTVVSQFFGSVSSPSVSSPVSKDSSTPPPVYPLHYEYFILSGRPVVRMFGSVFHEGDTCSRGVILRIFPDRIILHDGSFIENIQFSDTTQLMKRSLKNDRTTIH